MPTLALDGGDSRWWGGDQAGHPLVDTLPNARHRALEGQDHAIAPEALTPVLVEFVNA